MKKSPTVGIWMYKDLHRCIKKNFTYLQSFAEHWILDSYEREHNVVSYKTYTKKYIDQMKGK